MYDTEKLLASIEDIKSRNVLVLGDSMIDEIIEGEFSSSLSSPNTPKLKYKEIRRSMGGAGNVVEHLLELGARVSFITLVGDDLHFAHYQTWNSERLNPLYIVEEGRKNTVHTRFYVGEKRIFQTEYSEDKKSTNEIQDSIFQIAKEQTDLHDTIIFQDQHRGFFSPSLIERLKELTQGKRVLVNSQSGSQQNNLLNYCGVNTISMNLDEARDMNSEFIFEGDGKELTDMFCSNVCVTLGNRGAVYYAKNNRHYSPGIKVNEVDSCGAGDAFLSMFSCSDFEDQLEVALYLATVWAVLSVQKKGTEIPNLKELKEYILP